MQWIKIFVTISLLSSCAATVKIFGPPTYEYCGKADVLEVYRVVGGFMSCKEVLATTSAAYEIMWQYKKAGPLNEVWRVEYTRGTIDISDPYARTDYEEHLIQVQEQEPRSILHELYHAWMSETHSGGRSQHRKMCDDPDWQKIEHDFEVHPYCYLVKN